MWFSSRNFFCPQSHKPLAGFREGQRFPRMPVPTTAHFCNSKTAFENFEFVDNSIEDLLKCGSAVETSFVPKVISPLPVSTNAKGKQRLILDLRFVNSHLYGEYFRFDDWRSFERLRRWISI